MVLDGDEGVRGNYISDRGCLCGLSQTQCGFFVRSLEEDLKRRDFYSQRLCLGRETGEIIDLFHGLEDLEKKVLRAVGVASERFNEDACGLCVVFFSGQSWL